MNKKQIGTQGHWIFFGLVFIIFCFTFEQQIISKIAGVFGGILLGIWLTKLWLYKSKGILI